MVSTARNSSLAVVVGPRDIGCATDVHPSLVATAAENFQDAASTRLFHASSILIFDASVFLTSR